MEKAGEILKQLFQEYDLAKGKQYSRFFNSWESLVGKKVSGYSRILDLDGQILIVEVDHPAITQLITLQQKKIIKKINSTYPELAVKSLKIRVKMKGKQSVKVSNPQPAAEERLVQDEYLENKADDQKDLKILLKKLYNSVVNKQMRVDKKP